MGSIHKLIIEDDEGKTTVVPVSRGEISIGRMEGNTIRLMERNVSRRHARLLRENGTVFIEDLNSFNGVKINGERIDKRIEIKEGDLVEIGDYHLALQAAHLDEDAGQAVARETAGPVLTQATTVPGGAGHAAVAPNEATWRGGPGAPTIPEFRPPEEVLAEVRAEAYRAGGGHPQIANPPIASIGAPEPMVVPPQRPSQPVLPPFPAAPPPGAGGISLPTVPGLGVVPMPKQESAARTEQIQVGPPRIADVPRLVCVSTEYAGRDFPLSRPEIVIGRVEDNDVVIEHRSVSRNHAKIVFDGRVHKIIDLESANGILVNGEEYAITDLRKNDLIELGHVKFRFIPAGEPYSATEEEMRAMVDAGVSPNARTSDVTAAPSAPPPPAPSAPPPPSASKPSNAPSAKTDVPRPAAIPSPQPLPMQAREEGGATVEIPVGDNPSNAATVTDTPLSALVNVPELYEPRVDPGPGGTKPESAERRHEGRNGAAGAASLKRDEATQPDATASTTRSGGARPAAYPVPQRGHSPSKPASLRLGSDIGESAKDGRGKVIAAAALVLIVVGVLIFAGIKVRDTGSNADHEAQVLFDKGDYEGVENLVLNHFAEFHDKKKALELNSSAREKRKQKEENEPINQAAPKPGAVPAGDPTRAPDKPAVAAAEAAGTDELPAGDEEDSPKAGARPGAAPAPAGAAKAKPPAAAPAAAAALNKKNFDRAKQYEHEGRKMLLQGDLGRAEKLLMLCLQTAEYPACHRQLGVLYASRDDTRQAIKHYERYVELEPDAPDAPRVRALIKEARGGR